LKESFDFVVKGLGDRILSTEGDRFSLEIDRVTELKIINGSRSDRRGRLKLLWGWLRVPGG
jgi:hypothetical protein